MARSKIVKTPGRNQNKRRNLNNSRSSGISGIRKRKRTRRRTRRRNNSRATAIPSCDLERSEGAHCLNMTDFNSGTEERATDSGKMSTHRNELGKTNEDFMNISRLSTNSKLNDPDKSESTQTLSENSKSELLSPEYCDSSLTCDEFEKSNKKEQSLNDTTMISDSLLSPITGNLSFHESTCRISLFKDDRNTEMQVLPSDSIQFASPPDKLEKSTDKYRSLNVKGKNETKTSVAESNNSGDRLGEQTLCKTFPNTSDGMKEKRESEEVSYIKCDEINSSLDNSDVICLDDSKEMDHSLFFIDTNTGEEMPVVENVFNRNMEPTLNRKRKVVTECICIEDSDEDEVQCITPKNDTDVPTFIPLNNLGGSKNSVGPLRPIIIDGSNVAFGYGRANGTKFSCKGLKICVEYFRKKGHKVFAFVPQFRRCHQDTSDREILDALETERVLVYTPSRFVKGKVQCCYDDRFIVDFAARKGGVIVTRDNYRDLINEDDNWKDTIENRILMYTWVEDQLMFPKDPLGRDGPNLEQFLRFPKDVQYVNPV